MQQPPHRSSHFHAHLSLSIFLCCQAHHSAQNSVLPWRKMSGRWEVNVWRWTLIQYDCIMSRVVLACCLNFTNFFITPWHPLQLAALASQRTPASDLLFRDCFHCGLVSWYSGFIFLIQVLLLPRFESFNHSPPPSNWHWNSLSWFTRPWVIRPWSLT